MLDNLKKYLPAFFALAIICFLLPFFNFTCQGQKLATLTGMQLVAGTTIEQRDVFGRTKSEKVEREALAIVALLCGIVGLAASFLKTRIGTLSSMALGLVGIIFIFLLASKIDSDITGKSQGMVQTHLDIGF